MAAKKPTRPRDANQLAKRIVELATGEVEEPAEKSTKNPAAVELGRLGGKKGGKARAEKLTPEQRKEIAKKAAEARWKGQDRKE
jgi:hypothetical protein